MEVIKCDKCGTIYEKIPAMVGEGVFKVTAKYNGFEIKYDLCPKCKEDFLHGFLGLSKEGK